MANRIAENLYLPYEEIGRFLERFPNGMVFDVMVQKLPSLRNLSKKELAELLNYVRIKDKVQVIETTAKGVKTSPLLKHKMFAANLPIATNPPVVTSKNQVYSATPGRATLSLPVRQKNTLSQAINATVAKPMITPEEIRVATESLRHTHLKDQVLVVAAGAIVTALAKFKTGLTRTELGNEVVEYHRLRGAQRDIVLSYLVAKEHVVFTKVSPAGNTMNAGKYLHPSVVKPLDVATQRFDHDKPEITLDPIKPLKENDFSKVSTYVPVDLAKVEVDIKDEVVDEPMPPIEDLIMEFLEQGHGKLPMFHLYNYIPRYGELTEDERNEVINNLVQAGEIYLFRAKHPNSESTISWIGIDGLEDAAQRVVTCTKKIDAPSAMATAMVDALRNVNVVKPVITPKETETLIKENETMTIAQTPAKPMSAAELRQHISMMEAAAVKLEEEETNAVKLDAVKAVRDVIVKQFDIAQKALDAQIDAQAELGNAIQKLNEILG